MADIVVRTLACGMPLIVESMTGVTSAALHWLVPAGCATDPDEYDGISGIFEEILVRGAGAYDSKQHADLADRLGASRGTSAGTYTLGVSSTMLGSRVLEVLPMLTDMVLTPRMTQEGLDASRDLCLQAIDSLKDDPQQRASILARQRHYPYPINRSGMGTVEGLNACTKEVLAKHWQRLARPKSSVLGVAGAVHADAVEQRLNELFRDWQGSAPEPVLGPIPTRGYAHEQDKDGQQVQIIVTYDAPPEPHPDSMLEKFAVTVLSGGMSGRLFSEVREKRGLCYSVHAGYRGDRVTGAVSAYVGTTPERAQQSLDVLREELHRILTPQGRITPEEFARAKVGMKSGLVFSGESTAARAAALVTDWRRLGAPRTLDQVAQQIDSVTLDQVNAYLARRSLGVMTIQTLGPAALKA
jgi:predicted Zn-dependent peptidase